MMTLTNTKEITTMALTTGQLSAKAEQIEDWATRRPLINAIMAAWENANDTHAGQDVSEEQWEATAMATLESNLCYEEDAQVRAWFKAQGVRW